MRLKVNAYTNIRSAAAPGSSAAKAMEPEHAEKAAAESGAQAPGQSDAAAMMAYLRGKYGNIHFSVLSSANSGNIGSYGYGSGQTGFNHVAISETLLEKMGADEGLRRYVENILDHMGEYRNTARADAMIRDRKLVGMGLVIDDDAQAYMWTAVQKRDKDSVYPTYWRDRESTSFYAKNKKARRNSHYNYSHSNNMMRLASQSTENMPPCLRRSMRTLLEVCSLPLAMMSISGTCRLSRHQRPTPVTFRWTAEAKWSTPRLAVRKRPLMM